MDSAEIQFGYREMSEDSDHETQALEWCEAMIADALLDPDNED